MRKFTPLTAYAAVVDLSVTPAPYWGQDVSAAIIFIYNTGYILLLGLFSYMGSRTASIFNPNY